MDGWTGGCVDTWTLTLHFHDFISWKRVSIFSARPQQKKKKKCSASERERNIYTYVCIFSYWPTGEFISAGFPSLAPFQGLSISTKCRVNSWSSGVMDLGSHRAAACVKSHTAHLVFLRKAVENCKANEAALTEREERKQAGGNYWFNMKETEKEAGTIRERLCDTLKWISDPGRSQFCNHVGERCLLLCVKPQSWGIWNNMRFMAASEDDHNGSDKSLQI